MVIDLPALRSETRDKDTRHDAAGAPWFDARLEGLFGFGSPAKLDELQRFARLMQTQGQGVEATRMLFDAAYAHTQLQQGRVSRCVPLAELAESLHAQYQRAGQWLGIVN